MLRLMGFCFAILSSIPIVPSILYATAVVTGACLIVIYLIGDGGYGAGGLLAESLGST